MRKFDMRFQPATKSLKDLESPNEIWYIICVGECVLSINPGNMFGYQRLDFDPNVPYDELSSDESGVDASTTAKVSGTTPTAAQPQAKAPGVKSVTKVATSVTPGLLVAARSTSFAKPSTATTAGSVPRTSPPTTASTTVSADAKALSTSSSAKLSPRVTKAKSTIGTVAKEKPTPSSIVLLPLSTTSTLRKLSESQTTDVSPEPQCQNTRERRKIQAKFWWKIGLW